MDLDVGEIVGKVTSKALFHGKQAAVTEAQRHLIPHILNVFTDHDHEDVWGFIMTGYPLVREETPERVQTSLANLANNGTLRETYHSVLVNRVTPENVLEWLYNAEEWLPEDTDEETILEMEMVANTIEETEGGEAWLEAQVMAVYEMARAVPEGSSTRAHTD